MLDLDLAAQELQGKTRAQIEAETAWKWASRAIVCRKLARVKHGTDPGPFVDEAADLLAQAEDYEHEAIEHAALVRDDAVTLAAIETALVKYR